MFDLSKFPYPDEEGYQWFMLIVDHFTKFMWFVPLKSKCKEGVVEGLRALFDPARGGVPFPRRFHCDNGGEFVNAAMDELCKEFNIEQTHSRPRNPQCQGLVEERNKVVKRKIFEMKMAKGWVQQPTAKRRRGAAGTVRTMEWIPVARSIVHSENLNKVTTYDLSPYLCYHGKEFSTSSAPLCSKVPNSVWWRSVSRDINDNVRTTVSGTLRLA